MSRPCTYQTEAQRQAARRESRRKWREANPEKWAAVLARSYLKRKNKRARRNATIESAGARASAGGRKALRRTAGAAQG